MFNSHIFLLLAMSLFQLNLSSCKEPSYSDSNFNGFQKVNIHDLEMSVPKLFCKDWSLITAGVDTSFNTMTASWGGMGFLWEKNVAFIFIRPQRYTHEFLDREEGFTISFFDHAKYEEALKICGTNSGRNSNKVKEAGLSPIVCPAGGMAFREARIIVECKKMFVQPLAQQGFIDTTLVGKFYGKNDFHTLFIGEIVNVWKKE